MGEEEEGGGHSRAEEARESERAAAPLATPSP